MATRTKISTFSAEMLVAILAVVISLAGTVTNAILSKTELRHNRAVVYQECIDINSLKTVATQALQSAIVRAETSQGDSLVRKASIVELKREIGLLKKDKCHKPS